MISALTSLLHSLLCCSALYIELQVAKLEALTERYAKSGAAAEFVRSAEAIAGRDKLSAVLPDIIGALPQGEQKKSLFTIYSTQ